jgi:hypothetical protein
MRANERKTKLMGLESISIWTELNIQENDLMISSTDKEPRPGWMVRNIPVNMLMEKNTEKGNLNGLMAPNMKGTFRIIILRATENTNGQTEKNM